MNRSTYWPHVASTGLVRRIRYRHGLPFIISVVLAVVTTAWAQPTRARSIWGFALLALIATAFALLCGGRFRTFYVAIAVTLPFHFLLQWFLRVRSWIPDFPSKPVAEYFLYFVAAPILLVWVVATLLNRNERHA
ncbi:MAG TPA: hypothetical protein VFS12_12730 [Terriglobia bacterium]|nr:hypothetical protein [Terriglobia bacterium]